MSMELVRTKLIHNSPDIAAFVYRDPSLPPDKSYRGKVEFTVGGETQCLQLRGSFQTSDIAVGVAKKTVDAALRFIVDDNREEDC